MRKGAAAIVLFRHHSLPIGLSSPEGLIEKAVRKAILSPSLVKELSTPDLQQYAKSKKTEGLYNPPPA
jgi:hypothetical protein